ncbi:cagY like domain protein [Helicobacter pylori]|nr:cagY like domain protein [Helicobacter pylori]QQW94481.1 cagY like domain protein [Helicobacter pylori]
MACSFQGSLPHIATMGRDEILQQTPLNFISSNAKNKAFLKH